MSLRSLICRSHDDGMVTVRVQHDFYLGFGLRSRVRVFGKAKMAKDQSDNGGVSYQKLSDV